MRKYHWILPTNIDKADFDFSWEPDPYDPPYIHQFGTQWQDTGGPALVVDGATEVKYHQHMRVRKLPSHDHWQIMRPVLDWDYSWHPDDRDPPYIHQFPTQWSKLGGPRYVVPGARKIKYHDSPVARAAPTTGNWYSRYVFPDWDYSWYPDESEPPYIYVWGGQHYSPQSEPFITYTVPGAVQRKYITDKIVDYKLDVVFVSAGEEGEQQRFDKLYKLTNGRVKWVRNIRGREWALKRAAEISDTPWFYCFPGKLLVDDNFDFSWYPRPSYDAKHYIFYAQNPVNGLCYGHQAAVCYNRELVLDTPTDVLDFTLAQPHDIVPQISGLAQYDLDAFVCWRTAFREAVKLKLAIEHGDSDSEHRLNIWLTQTDHHMSSVSVDGARAGLQYYHDVGGNQQQLQASWDWDWLKVQYRQLDK